MISFFLLQKVSSSHDRKIASIANSYHLLIQTKGMKIHSCQEIRKVYDILLKDFIDEKVRPDGQYFRKEPVFITNGIKTIHKGTSGEENIQKEMNEFLELYNEEDIDILTRMILCHFLFESIHPFYDGNGRMGRFLFSNGLYSETKSPFSFLISSAFEKEKGKYYKAFEQASERYEFGSLNSYAETILEILSSHLEEETQKMITKKERLNQIQIPFRMTASEERIYKVLYEGTLFSDFGISNEEITKQTGVSKRTLLYALKGFKKKNLLNDTKIGKYQYHRIKL